MNNELFESYLSRALDCDLSPEEFAEFEKHLIESPEARVRYMECIDLHNALDLELHQAASAQLGTSSVIDVKRIIRRQKRRTLEIAAISAAAILIIALITMRLFFITDKEPTLVFETSPGTQFALTHSSSGEAPEGLTLEKGSRLQLSQGTVELTFGSGVKSIVTAPADMTLHDDDTLFLNKGTAWFQVPKGQEGFTVRTSDLDIVDLGTEFGVLAKPDDHDEVHVFKGKVQITTLRLRKESVMLTAGNACRIDPVGRLTALPTKPSTFLTSLPNSLPHLHWSFDGDQPFQPEGSLPEIKTITSRPVQSNSRQASTRLTAGKNGNALSFDGKGDHLKTNWTGILERDPRSVACWIKIPPNEPDSWGSIVEWGEMSGSHYWRFRVAKSNTHPKQAILRLSLGRSWYNGQTNLADGKWHHVAVVDSGDLNDAGEPEITFYIDGKDERAIHDRSSETVRFRITAEELPMTMGIYHTKSEASYLPFHGLIDELFIFRAALPPSQIQRIMQTNQP